MELDRHSTQARFARVLDSVRIPVVPDAVPDRCAGEHGHNSALDAEICDLAGIAAEEEQHREIDVIGPADPAGDREGSRGTTRHHPRSHSGADGISSATVNVLPGVNTYGRSRNHRGLCRFGGGIAQAGRGWRDGEDRIIGPEVIDHSGRHVKGDIDETIDRTSRVRDDRYCPPSPDSWSLCSPASRHRGLAFSSPESRVIVPVRPLAGETSLSCVPSPP